LATLWHGAFAMTPNDIISYAVAEQPLTVTNATAADWKTESLHEL